MHRASSYSLPIPLAHSQHTGQSPGQDVARAQWRWKPWGESSLETVQATSLTLEPTLWHLQNHDKVSWSFKSKHFVTATWVDLCILWKTQHLSPALPFVRIYFSFLSHVDVCVVCIYVCIFACMWTHVCMCVCRPRVNVACPPWSLKFIYCSRVFCWTQIFLIRAILASQPALGFPCLCLLSTGVTGKNHVFSSICLVSGNYTSSLHAYRARSLYPSSCLCPP